jgi:DNA-binding transcriptional LysR family regulator
MSKSKGNVGPARERAARNTLPGALPGRLNLRAMDAFRMTLEHGSASAAARELGVTQPAISRLLTLLESEVGFELFDRDRGRLVPTQEAKLLAREVGLVLGRLDHISILARNLGLGVAGELRLVSPPSLAEGPLAPIIASFMALHPQLRISVCPRDVRMGEELVATRAMDCAFARLPVEHPDVTAELLVTNQTVCVLPPRHRLAKLTTIGPADLAGVPLIFLLSVGSRAGMDAAFERAGVVPNVRLETQTIGSACAFAEQGVGVAVVNELLARRYVRGGMRLRPFRPRLLHQYGFVTAADAPMTRVTRIFFEHCQREFAKLGLSK